jgi:predicted  nucleic acid-binding Zn-ribbon protein
MAFRFKILNHLELADTQRFDMVVQIGLLPPSDRAGFIATLDSFASRTIAALVSLRSSLAEEQTAHSATSEADKSRITYLEARVKSSNSDFDFVKAQYDQASTHAARFSRELQEAEETIVTLRGQVKAGLDLARQTYKRRCEGLEGELRVYKAQVGVMKEVARKTDGIRERAGRVDGLENEVRRLRAALEEETEDRKRFEVRSKTAEERIRRELPPPEEDDSDDDSDGAGSFRPDESDGGSDSDYEDSDVEEEVAGLAAVDDVAIPPAQSQADASASSATQTQSETQTHPTQPSAFSIFHGLAPALAPFAAHSNQSQPSLQPEPKPSFRSGSFFSPSVSPARSPPSQPRHTSTSAATAAIVNLSASPAVANLSPPQAFNAAFLDSQQTHPQAQPPAATTATTPETQQTQTQQSSTIFPLNSLSRNAVGYVQALLTGGGAFGMDVDDDEHDENEDPAVARSTAGGMQADAPLPKPDFGPNPNVCLWRVPAGTVSIPTSAADSRNGEGFCLVVAENEDVGPSAP